VTRGGTVGQWDGRVGAEWDAVRDGACASRVGEDAGVDGENVRHGEERGRTGSELGREGRVSFGELEALSDPGGGYVGVQPCRERGFHGWWWSCHFKYSTKLFGEGERLCVSVVWDTEKRSYAVSL